MRLKFLLILTCFISTLSSVGLAEKAERIIGQDWLLMSREEKGTYIFTAMEVLKRHDAPLGKTPDQYVALIDSELIGNPDSLKADVTNILATVVYENEPGARGALDKIRK